MKKMKGTKHAHIGKTYHDLRDADIDRMEMAVLNQQARLNAAILMLKKVYGDEADWLPKLS